MTVSPTTASPLATEPHRYQLRHVQRPQNRPPITAPAAPGFRMGDTAANLLRPALIVTASRTSASHLCDNEGSVASLALSHSLSVGFTAHTADGPNSSGSALLHHRDLDALGLTIRQAWTQAAKNLCERSRISHRITFWQRPAIALGARSHLRSENGGDSALNKAVQVASPGGLATSWLCHPRTFTILNGHLQIQLETPRVVYCMPSPEILIVAPDTGHADAYRLAQWAVEVAGSHREKGAVPDTLVYFPLVWADGFPREYLS